MQWSILYYGFLLFAAGLATHVILWRIRHPKRQIMTLFVLFFFVPMLFHVLFRIVGGLYGASGLLAKSIPPFAGGELPAAFILCYALSLTYIFTYPAAQAGCPTFVVLMLIKAAMPRGASKDEIYTYCREKGLFGLEVQDLVDEDLITEKNGQLAPTQKGKNLLGIFSFMRKVFGLPPGRG